MTYGFRRPATIRPRYGLRLHGEGLVVSRNHGTAVLRYLEEYILRDTKSTASIRVSIVSTRL